MRTEREVCERISKIKDEIRDLQMGGDNASFLYLELHALEWVVKLPPTTDVWAEERKNPPTILHS